MRVLFVTNGHGEDSMAAEIVRRLPPGIEAEAYPMLGEGLAWRNVCRVVGPRAGLPSQGERMVSGTHLADLRAGSIRNFWPAVSFMRRHGRRYDRRVVLGDLVGVMLCFLAGARADIWIDAFRNGYAHTYSRPEAWLIRRAAGIVFCRDDILAARLRAAGIDARAEGNILMDTITYGRYDPAPHRTRDLALLVLPGSRAVAPDQFAVEAAAIRLLPEALRPDLFVALAPGIEPDMLAAASGLFWMPTRTGDPDDLGRLEGKGLVFNLARGALGNLIDACDLVLSPAGTATWQALGRGRPVVSTVTEDTRSKRLRDEAALTGESRQVCPRDSQAIASALSDLLTDPAERARRAAIGRERLGAPGAIDAVIAALA